jgi:O-antigen/teichoic acid export membrane protein
LDVRGTNVDAPTTTPTSLVANSRWNLLAFTFALASNFIILPFVVKWIGLPEFGRAGLVLAVVAPLILIGTVLSQALVREMSSRLGAGDTEGSLRALDAALGMCVLASGAGWVLLVVVGPQFTNFLLGGLTPAGSLQLAFVIAATGWFMQQVALVLQATSAARQDFRTVAQVAAFSATANVVATLVVTYILPTVEGYLAGVGIGLGLSLGAWFWVLRKDVNVLRFAGGRRGPESRALLAFGKWQTVAHLAGAVSHQIDRYALGAVASVAVVGQYNVANRLQEAGYIGAIKGGEVLFPRFGSLSHRSIEERGELFQTASWVVGTFGAMLLAPLVPLSGAVLTLWVGAEAAEGGAFFLRTLIIAGVIACGSNVFSYHAMGIGRNAPVAAITLLYSAITVAFTVVLIKAFGPAAAGTGLVVASVVRVTAALVLTHRDFFPQLAWAELMTSTVLPVAAGVLLAVGALRLGVGEVHGLAQVAVLYVALATTVLAASVAGSALTDGGRKILWRAFRIFADRP